MSEPAVEHLLGWCQSAPGAKPDTYHGLCRREFTGQNGVLHRCTCPNHQEGDGESRSTEGETESTHGKIGAQVKTAPGGALTPEPQGLADYQGVD